MRAINYYIVILAMVLALAAGIPSCIVIIIKKFNYLSRVTKISLIESIILASISILVSLIVIIIFIPLILFIHGTDCMREKH